MYDHILVATDGTEFSEQAIVEGAKLAKALGSKVTVVTAVQTPAPLVVEGAIIGPGLHDREMTAKTRAGGFLEAAADAAAKVGVKVATECALDEAPYNAIVATAKSKGCDLIVMASHGRSGLTGLLLGSETQKVLTYSTIPVLVHRN